MSPDVASPVSSSRSESAAHRELKRLALGWARERRLVLGACEVRVPRSPYRADVAAATPRITSDNAVTAIFECKVSRADFRRDSESETGAREHIRALADRLGELRRLIASHRPDLRRGEELFPEWDCIDLRGLRHDTHDALVAALRTARTRFEECTKFARLARWRAATFHYLVAEEGLFESWEIPDDWGWLVRRGEALELKQPPLRHETTPEERVAFVERIAAKAK